MASKQYGYKIWTGTVTEYKNLHRRINQEFGSPRLCQDCGAIEGIIEWANLSGEYKEVREDWERLCRKCHMHKDGRAFSKPATGMKHTVETKARISISLKKNRWPNNSSLNLTKEIK
jgi:hypothetical protein